MDVRSTLDDCAKRLQSLSQEVSEQTPLLRKDTRYEQGVMVGMKIGYITAQQEFMKQALEDQSSE